jgi:ATP-dependent DNA helicase RecG
MRQIFISSVQRELQEFRLAIRDYVNGDPLLAQFFNVFLFEDLPAGDRRADDVYLEQVAKSDLYLGLFANEYGWEDADGLSPTHREFNAATDNGVERVIFVIDLEGKRHPKMLALIAEASDQLIRRRVSLIEELLDAIYHSLIEYLRRKQLIVTSPFDQTACRGATMHEVSGERIKWFLSRARAERGFAVSTDATNSQALTHLNQLVDGIPSNAAILLFGTEPQRFVPAAEVKCAHHHGLTVQKPIPDYKVFKGDLFQQVDSAVDFVMSKLARSVGTRSEGVEAPASYEIPREVIAEAIVNAIVHRDYTSAGAVQVAVFRDRVEIRNPGRLPHELSIESLGQEHASYPRNSRLADSMYYVRYIEKLGTGTLDMVRLCQQAELAAPVFSQVGAEFVVSLGRFDRQRLEAMGLNARQIEIMILIGAQKRITNADAQELTGANRKAASRDLDDLVEKGLIERHGHGRGTHYTMTEK